MSEKITAFLKKVIVWREHFENRSLEIIPSSRDFVARSGAKVSPIKKPHTSTLNLRNNFLTRL